MTGMQQSVTKSQPDLVSTVMNVFNSWDVCLEMCGHHDDVMGGQTDRCTSE